MREFIFDLQRFATQTISAGNTYALDGVTYTATTNSVLNIDNGKVSGIASGKVKAVVTGAENSPTVTFDASQTTLPVAVTKENNSLAVTFGGRTFKFAEGTATIARDKVTMGAAVFSVSGSYSNADYKFTVADSAEFSITADSFSITSEKVSVDVIRGGRTLNFGISGTAIRNFTDHTFALAGGTSISTTLSGYTFNAKVPDGASVGFNLTESGIIFKPGENNGSIAVSVNRGDTPLFGGNVSVSGGSIGFNLATQSLSFTKGTTTTLTLPNAYSMSLTTTDAASVKISADANGNFKITPSENDGALDITIKRGDTFIFSNIVSVSGEITFNPATQSISLADGTKMSVKFGNYEVTATADGDAAVSVAMTPAGLSITPVKGDGTLNLKLGSESGSLSANLEVLSGSFILSENGTLTVTKDTELQFDFGGGYVVKFKTTDDAGGKISLDADGLTFTPTEGDGHLELSVTRGGETRTATLEMTGSLTYKLDGSISLAKDTVVKNIFEDGNILTITANTDASGSMIFDPNSGLYITPSTPDALNVVLTTDGLDVVNISSITGTINYTGGVVTASDGTKAHISYYFGWESELRTTGGTASIQFTADRTVYTANEGSTFLIDYLDGTTSEIQNGTYSDIYATETEDAIELISAGSTFKCNDEEVIFTLESAGSYTLNGIAVTTTAANTQVQLTNYDTIIVDGISYTPLDDNVTLTIGDTGATCAGGKVTMQMEGFDIALSEDVTDGSISYDSTTNKFTVKAGTKSYLGEGNFPDQFVAKNDFDISVTKTDDGKFKFSLGDESVSFDLTRNGTAIMGSTITLDGSILVDPTNNEISLPKDTVLTLTQGTGKKLQITALDDAGGELTFANGGLRFKPNENDGALEFNFVDAERKATLDVTGAFTYKGLGALSLEDGTVANLTWTDGTKLKITSSGSTGSIGIDPDKGIKITSDDENLNMTLTTPYMSTDISGIKGTIYYKEGNVSFDENSKITATTTLGGQPILTTLETIDGTGHISFSGTTNGIVYSADTGAMKITWSRDDLESTFVVNKGSVQIGHNLFKIAEGTDLATDLKNFVPALYFTTAEAGTYTINGQTIKTSAEGLALTATDDQMVFKTSGDVVEYDGMTFAGDGNVSLKADNVVLGAGVEAKGFGKDKSFVLAEAGNVTADAKVFELTELDTAIKIPMEISVTGAQDGFTFSRTLTKESEAYLDDALTEEKFGNYSSSYIGQVFTEKFISAGDSSYRIRTDAIGLEEVIGISNGATINGGASLADKPTLSYYNLVTDTTGKFTIGERTYNVSGDSSIALRARFEENAAPYASMVDSLNGTISGDFSGGNFSINGSSALKVIGDTDISIVADKSGFEILGLDAGANLQVSAAGTYTVNGTEIAAGASSVIIGTADGKARLHNLPAELADFMLHKTAAGYPQMAALAFHPDEKDPDAPTNYHSAEKWTTASTDDLQLSAIHYSPENPTGKWVILVHGYGKKGAAMNACAEPYLAQGMDVLIVDQRTAGDSEGDWLTMGVAEANDLAIWTQEIAKTNANAQITLHGVSMGAATVMLAAALPETTNVSAMIEDCGYGNIADVFATLLTYYGSSLGVGDVDYYKLFDDVAAVAKTLDGGYDVGDAAPIDSIAAVTVPSLFIHGAADVVIPSTNADALYDKSGAKNKTKLIIEGAGHAKSVELDTEAYLTAVKKLVDSSTKEIGASIDSDANHKLLRGTIYNDTITNSGTAVTIQGLGGNDYIVNNVDSSLVAAELANSIDAGEGNDTIYSYHTYNPTLLGGEGDDSIVVERGHKTFADGGMGNDTIIGLSKVGGWGMGDYATILGGEGNDYINPIYSANALIDGGNGNDTIFANGANATIDGGDGNNLIVMTDDEGGANGKFVVLSGNTTVENFNTGFGEGTDTIYIDGDPAGVYFKDGVLTFSNSTDSLTLSDVTTTAKVNIYHKRREVLNKGVFIADNDWYSVSSGDLSVSSGEEVYFVGPSATQNHGVDFSGITQDLNVTIDTAYIDSKDYIPTTMWINGVYSLKGGAGNTKITGSDKNDTIIAGKGKTTIDGGKGDDYISLNSAAALIEYRAGDGNDKISGFNSNSTLSISGSEYSKSKNGNDVIVTVGDEKITLSGAAKLSSLNIEGKQLPVSVEESIAYITNGYVTNYYDYGKPITDQNQVKTLLEGDLNGDMALLLENKSADFSEYSGRKNVTLLGGENQSVTFNKEGHNTAIVDENTSGTKNIHLGGGGDLVFVEDTGARVNITASNGNDIIVSEGENVFVDLKGGKTDIFASSGKMTLNGYNASTNSGFGTNYSDILAAINNGEIYFDKGQMSVGSAVIDFNGLSSGVVNFFDLAGKMQKVGNAAPNETLDLSKETANLILAADKNSTLTAGAGNDSIFAYAGSRVDAGAGNNSIYMEESGATIVFSAGNTTIKDIHNTFDNGDILEVDPANVSYNGKDLIISGENFKATVESPDKDSVSAYVNQLVKDSNGKTWKMAIGGENTVIDVKADEKLRADYYKAGGVTFENYDGKVQIDLSDGEDAWSSFIGNKAAVFDGVTSVKAGAGDTTLKGSDANETFIAGNGNSSLYGAGGKNLLIGYEGEASLKEGSTTFFVLGVYDLADNTIQSFAFVNDDNYANKSADMIEIDTATNFIRQESIEVIGNDVAFSVENRNTGVTESVLVKNAASTSDNVKDMRFSDGVTAQVSTNDLCFDKFANFYVATGKNATVNVSNDTEYSKVWLDNAAAIENGSDANAIFVGDIRVIDATNSTVTAELAGNDLDNTILAGTGDSSLWGGNGGNDLLIGGESKNTFFYTLGNGNDTITNVNDGDIVDLAGVSLENIIGADFSNNALALNFSDGGKLTVNENGKGVNFVVGDQIFYVNNEHNGFVTKK